ncbi:MAG: carboxypeptidase-like regulatory domain-containing protein [Daejeonella sp.]
MDRFLPISLWQVHCHIDFNDFSKKNRELLKRKIYSFFSTLLLIISLSVSAFSQTHSVSGTVTDTRGEPLIGVSVKALNSTAGASSDVNGKFSFNVSNAYGTLIFTYIGYTTTTARAKDT